MPALPRSRDRRNGRSSGSVLLTVLGAVFAIYCLFLLQLHLWTQQVDTASHRVGDDARPPNRGLERDVKPAAQAVAQAAGQAATFLRPGHRDALAVPVVTEAQAQEEPVQDEQEHEKLVQPTVVVVAPSETATATAAVKAKTEAALVDGGEAKAPVVRDGGEDAAAKAAPLVETTTAPADEQAAAPQVVDKDLQQGVDAPVIPTQAEVSEERNGNMERRDPIAEQEQAPVPTEAVAVSTTTAPPATSVSFRSRHQEISGYEKTMAFLESYLGTPDESLFLLFVCSDDQFRSQDWSEDCRLAKQHVYDVFDKSPSRNKLVTIFAGSERYWKFQNDFYNDPDLRVKGVPCLLKWEGDRGRTSGMMVHQSLQYDVFLRYLFKNDDQPDEYLTPEAVEGKQIVTVAGYQAYQDTMAAFKREKYPVTTFMIMVSGRFKNNNRPWCPYCRYSHLPLEYSFYAFAPPNSRLLRVEVTDTYTEWKHPNAFNRDKELDMHVVPALYRLNVSPAQQIPGGDANAIGTIEYERHKVRLDLLESLRRVFSGIEGSDSAMSQ